MPMSSSRFERASSAGQVCVRRVSRVGGGARPGLWQAEVDGVLSHTLTRAARHGALTVVSGGSGHTTGSVIHKGLTQNCF